MAAGGSRRSATAARTAASSARSTSAHELTGQSGSRGVPAVGSNPRKVSIAVAAHHAPSMRTGCRGASAMVDVATGAGDTAACIRSGSGPESASCGPEARLSSHRPGSRHRLRGPSLLPVHPQRCRMLRVATGRTACVGFMVSADIKEALSDQHMGSLFSAGNPADTCVATPCGSN